MEYFCIILFSYLAVINLIGLVAVGIDKSRSKKGKWRIKEATLFFFVLIGGSFGVYLGMNLFRHKIQKNSFVFLIPIIFGFQCALIWAVLKYNNVA